MDKMETDYIVIIEGISSLKSLLEALNTKVAQMQIKLNTISANVSVNTSTTDVEEVKHGKPIVYEVHQRYVTGAAVDETGTPFLLRKEYVEERERCPFCNAVLFGEWGYYCDKCGAKMDKEKEE